jgi:hypothetical protein
MKLRTESIVRFPRELVFRTYRDRLVELVPFLPNVRAIEERSRDEQAPITNVVNVWHGGGDLPAAVRGVLSERMLSWTDHARWDASSWRCAWRMESHAFREALRAEGENEFREVEGGCVLRIEGDIAIDGRRLPVPRLLAGPAGAAAERFLVAAIQPNLAAVSRGVQRFLESSK